MKAFVLISLVTMIFGCAQVRPLSSTTSPDKEFVFKKVQRTLQPGMVALIEFNVPSDFQTNILYCPAQRDKEKIKEIPIAIENNMAKTFMSESYFSELKPFACFVKYQDQEITVVEFKVDIYPYKSETLNVAMGKVVLSEANKKRVEREWLITSKLYKNSASYFLFDEPFIAPLDSFLTSIYGTKRLFNNQKSSQHLGNDFRAKIGVPIPVSNRGRVVYVGDLFYTGKVVIVDHGMNIFSNYAHLSRIDVKVGDVVNRGQIVGLSGATGRVSGPHLHWGVKVHDEWIDGFSLIKESEKMFSSKK